MGPNVNEFTEERGCLFGEERFSVRDNGAVFRHHREGKRRRKNDERWTFGDEDSSHPYLHLSGARIHRIVATAFHGEPPDPKYVVDHIDSNCRNNRPENLRWATRLENALSNPVTRRKIEYLCGSIEAFLRNPSQLNALRTDSSFAWMRSVTPEEAEHCLRRMTLWANTDMPEGRSRQGDDYRRSFEERVFKPLQKWEAGLAGEPGLEFASTPWCGKYMWRSEVHFPCCPEAPGRDALKDYFERLRVGAVFAYCAPGGPHSHPELTVSKTRLLERDRSIVVMCARPDSFWSLAGIWLNEKSHFVHFHLGAYHEAYNAAGVLLTIRGADFWSAGYSSTWDPG